MLDGSWRYCTGFLHSQWCLGAALPADGSGPALYCLVPSVELEVADDWHTYGLKGTGSVSVVARRVFVPEHRVISVDAFRHHATASRIIAAKPNYRVPALVLGQALMTGQFFGGARYALSGFLERLPGRPLAFTDYAGQREAPVTHLQVAEAALLAEDAEARAHRFADLIARKVAADEAWTVAERVAARAQTGWVARQCTAAVDLLARAGGAGSLYRDVPLRRVHQDLQAAALHAFVVPSVNLELYGRALVGLEPNSAFL